MDCQFADRPSFGDALEVVDIVRKGQVAERKTDLMRLGACLTGSIANWMDSGGTFAFSDGEDAPSEPGTLDEACDAVVASTPVAGDDDAEPAELSPMAIWAIFKLVRLVAPLLFDEQG